MEALLGHRTLAGLAEQDSPSSQQRQLEISLGYGYVAGAVFIVTPELGLSLSPQRREYRAGWKLALASRSKGAPELKFDVRREENTEDDTAPRHMIGLRLQARF